MAATRTWVFPAMQGEDRTGAPIVVDQTRLPDLTAYRMPSSEPQRMVSDLFQTRKGQCGEEKERSSCQEGSFPPEQWGEERNDQQTSAREG